MTITLGTRTADGKKAALHLDTMLRTRLLIQASSGAGKSWLLRRLAEQLYGKVPVILIDPEGEFATLREAFGYVLVGKGGDTPADARSAELVAHRLLELRASAVCDIFELKPKDRHVWVQTFLDAMIDAPKKLWGQTVVIVDEAHLFCPEKGAGESDASDAMISLATRGRKRGFCPVWATQRLGKLRKDAAAELLNVLIGQTFVDVDVDRAAEVLGVSKDDKHAFKNEIKTLDPGQFYGFGRAIALDRTLITIGDVQTTHPKPGSAKHAAAPPPAPDVVRKLLPSLADLPQEAETKAKTEAELKKVIVDLKRQLRERPAVLVPNPDRRVKVVEKPVLKDGQLARAEKICGHIERLHAGFREQLEALVYAGKELEAAIGRRPPEDIVLLRRTPVGTPPVSVRGTGFLADALKAVQPRVEASIKAAVRRAADESSNGDLSDPARKILGAVAELKALGLYPADKQQVALMAGYTNVRSGGFSEPFGQLTGGGYVVSDRGAVTITAAGEAAAPAIDPPASSEELQARILRNLSGPEQKLLAAAITHWPRAITKEQLASETGYTNIRSGGFSEPVGRLSRLQLLITERGSARASDALFLERP